MPNNVAVSPIFSPFALQNLKSEAGLFLSLFSGEIRRVKKIYLYQQITRIMDISKLLERFSTKKIR
ncbi:MAG: hypothetical protein ACKO5L_07725, partial [Bacteroidota bacterium]